MRTGKTAVSLSHPQSLGQHNYVAHKAPRGAKHPGKCSPRTEKKNHFPETRPRRHGGTRSERVRLLCAVAGAGVWAIGSKWGWGDGDAGRDEGSVGTTPTAWGKTPGLSWRRVRGRAAGTRA